MEKATYFAIRNATHQLWGQRTSHQRRAISFIVLFVILLALWIWSATDASVSPATILYRQMSEPTWTRLVADVPEYHIMAVADNDDRNSVEGRPEKKSALAEGTLRVTLKDGKPSFSVHWGTTSVIQSGFVHDGRGLELSTLQFWNGARLYSCDDHTGIVYEVILEEGLRPQLAPRHILSDGNGRAPLGMRCEWSTTKGDFLMVGSTGHPWTDRSGTAVNRHPLWIKTISPLGVVKHIDWSAPYESMRAAMGVNRNGYLIHECGLWSSRWNRWYFIPRHVSNTPYRPGDEHSHGSTAIIVTDASFQRIVVNPLEIRNSENPTSGVTDCKFVPNGRDREILVIKTDESKSGVAEALVNGGRAAKTANRNNNKQPGAESGSAAVFQSYLSIINTDGTVLMDDVPMPSGWKFEGVELRPILHSEK